MSKGIICKVWNISGNTSSKTAKKNLGDSIDYILNDEKTDAIIGNLNTFSNEQLLREVTYVENDLKTLHGAYIGSYNLKSTNVKEAVSEMMDVKKFYGKTDGRSALHGVISLEEIDSSPENAPKLIAMCKDVLQAVFPNNQAIFAVHTNTDNLHIHFIVNSVGLNGYKIHQPEGFIRNVLQPQVNRFAEKYGFTPNPLWTMGQKEKSDFVINKINMRRLIDMAIEDSDTMEEFVEFMEMAGYKVNAGKYISLKNDDMKKALRTYQLGPNYTTDAIIERMLNKRAEIAMGEVGDYVPSNDNNIDMFVGQGKLKRYKDMTRLEKKRVIKKLREGKNPWRDAYAQNWQLSRMQREIELNEHAKKVIKALSDNESIEATLSKIIELKKQLSSEKKALKDNVKKYKQIIDIYKEMQKYEKRAFLYEYEHHNEYRYEYEEYKELYDRLKDNYNKKPEDVAAFLEETDNRILYANSQLEELSASYREIKKYGLISGNYVKKESILEHIDYQRIKNTADNYRSFATGRNFIATDNPHIVLMVDTGVYVKNNGRQIAGFNITILSKEGEILAKLNNYENEGTFTSKLYQIEKRYKLKNAHVYDNMQDAIYSLNRKAEDPATYKNGDDIEDIIEHELYSFTGIINDKQIKEDNYYCSNLSSPVFLMNIVKDKDSITLNAISGIETIETVTIPRNGKKNSEGYTKLSEFKKKYGFSDEMLLFIKYEDAVLYQENKSSDSHAQERKYGING